MTEAAEKCEELISEQLSVLDELETRESDLLAHLIYRDPKPITPPSSAKAAPKGKDKKGKDKTPVQSEPIDPVLQAKIDRAENCKNEALEGVRLVVVGAKARLEVMKHVLKATLDDLKNRLEESLANMASMIEDAFKARN